MTVVGGIEVGVVVGAGGVSVLKIIGVCDGSAVAGGGVGSRWILMLQADVRAQMAMTITVANKRIFVLLTRPHVHKIYAQYAICVAVVGGVVGTT